MRHNNLRNVEADFLSEACRDVKIEHELIPIEDDENDKSILDVSAVGVWSTFERSFVDVRVTHPLCSSYVGTPIQSVYRQHENEKKRKYLQRVLQVEKASFTPLIFTTTGGCGPEADRFHKRVASLLAVKRKEAYGDIMNYMRTRLSFALLKSVLISLRGFRGKPEKQVNLQTVSFNLVPSIPDIN